MDANDKADACCGYATSCCAYDKESLFTRSIEGIPLDALAFYLLSSVFNYVKQLQQMHKAPTLNIVSTWKDYFQSEKFCWNIQYQHGSKEGAQFTSF